MSDMSDLLAKGQAALQRGEFAAALDAFRAAGANGDNWAACIGAGRALSELDDLAGATRQFAVASRLEPHNPDSFYELGRHFARHDLVEMALGQFKRTRQLHPGWRDTERRFMRCLSRTQLLPSFDLYDDCLAMLTSGNFDDRVAVGVVEQVLARRTQDLAGLDDAALVQGLARDELLLRFLERCGNSSPVLERLLVRARRYLCLGAADGWSGASPVTGFALALAMGFESCDYVVAPDTDEQTRLDGLAASGVNAAAAIIIEAMYRRPAPERVARAAEAIDDGQPGASLFLQRFLHEPLALAREVVASLTTIDGTVSQRVRSQYEAYPFPRWRWIVPGEPRLLDAYVRGRAPRGVDRPLPSPGRVLVAGCGTGRHALYVAAALTDARVTAVDLSAASLAYGQMRARELGIGNVDFLQADITQMTPDHGRHDLIEVIGVMHHTADPLYTWGRLRALLQPGGWMRIGVYSAVARSRITAVRATLPPADGTDPRQQIHALRQQVIAGGPDHPWHFLTGIREFYNLNHLRDLLFHAQEVPFTMDMIREGLRANGLRFCGFELRSQQILRRFRKHWADAADPLDLGMWEAFEASNPRIFAGMYTFWCTADPDLS